MAFPSTLSSDAIARPALTPASPDSIAALRGQPSAVSWGAILAGAAAAASLSLILLILGTGLGLSAVSPWAKEGLSATSLGVSTIVWLTVTQLLSAALGGYLAGRLRGQWLDVQTDEIYFRDTAHGFLAWAVASLLSAALLSASIAAIVGGTGKAVAQVGAEIVRSGMDSAALDYEVDALFRQPAAKPATNGGADTASRAAVAAEASAILMYSLRNGSLQPEDQRHLGQLVAQHTGLVEQEAIQRVRNNHLRAQTALRNAEAAALEATNKARKASAYAALWMVVALLGGAFVASLAATVGGRQRDA